MQCVKEMRNTGKRKRSKEGEVVGMYRKEIQTRGVGGAKQGVNENK